VLHILERNNFGPFSEVIRTNQHEMMPLQRWRMYLPNKIQSPFSKWS
jgi:hypothetical protein